MSLKGEEACQKISLREKRTFRRYREKEKAVFPLIGEGTIGLLFILGEALKNHRKRIRKGTANFTRSCGGGGVGGGEERINLIERIAEFERLQEPAPEGRTSAIKEEGEASTC